MQRSRRLFPSPALRVVLAGALVALLLAGCSGDDGQDREEAIERARVQAPRDATDEELGCYVDRVSDELGSHLLAEDHQPTPIEVRQLARLRVECLGVASLGLPAPLADGPPVERSDGEPLPNERGDDAYLDGLWVACADANLMACDELFEQAPPGSAYERFGATCGDRGAAERCAVP